MGLLDPDSLVDKDVDALSETVARCSQCTGSARLNFFCLSEFWVCRQLWTARQAAGASVVRMSVTVAYHLLLVITYVKACSKVISWQFTKPL